MDLKICQEYSLSVNSFIFSLSGSVSEGVLEVETQPYRAHTSVGRYLPPRRAKGSASNTTTLYCLPPVLPTTFQRWLAQTSSLAG